jgi:hypothetical protein
MQQAHLRLSHRRSAGWAGQPDAGFIHSSDKLAAAAMLQIEGVKGFERGGCCRVHGQMRRALEGYGSVDSRS